MLITTKETLEESDKAMTAAMNSLQQSNDEFEQFTKGITQLTKQLSLDVSIEHNNELMDVLGAMEDRINELIGKFFCYFSFVIFNSPISRESRHR